MASTDLKDVEETWNEVVHNSPLGGKGLFAPKDIGAGEGIFNIMRPLVTALDNRRLKDTCANCYEWTAGVFIHELANEYEPSNLQTCAGCKTLRYCSKRCQAESWKREHKKVCKLLGRLHQKGTLPNASRAILRMLQLATGPSSRALLDMKSHLNKITARGGQRAEYLLVMSTGIHEYSGTPFGIEYVQNFFAIVLTNSLTIWTPTFDPLGIAIDPLAAKANHSCNPNAVAVWDGLELQLRSLRPIRRGEEVFISYIDPTQPYSRRQHELDEKFYFECNCSKCQLEWSGPDDKFAKQPDFSESYGMETIMHVAPEDIAKPVLQEMLAKPNNKKDPDFLGVSTPSKPDLSNMFQGYNGLRYVQKMAYANYEAASKSGELEHMAVLEIGLRICMSTDIWPAARQPLPMIRHSALINYLMTASRFPEAYVFAFLQSLKLYFDCLPTNYPQTFHPMRVINKWTIANLALYLAAGLEQENKTVLDIVSRGVDFGVVIWGFLREVLDNVEKSHGKSHSFATAVKRKVDEVRTDMTRADSSKVKWAETQISNQWKILRQIIQDPQINIFNQFKKKTNEHTQEIEATGKE